jgi:hypothetical protein
MTPAAERLLKRIAVLPQIARGVAAKELQDLGLIAHESASARWKTTDAGMAEALRLAERDAAAPAPPRVPVLADDIYKLFHLTDHPDAACLERLHAGGVVYFWPGKGQPFALTPCGEALKEYLGPSPLREMIGLILPAFNWDAWEGDRPVPEL